MKTLHLKSTVVICLLTVISMLLPSCNESSPTVFTEMKPEAVSQQYAHMRSLAANLAKVLAIDLNKNEEHRKELFSKMANKFDGDFDILFASLYESTLQEVQEFSTQIPQNINRVSLQQLERSMPKLELMMPYMKRWTDNQISEAGGLIVAYYPFGADDRNLKEIKGFDKEGKEVNIKPESAASIPYILLRTNERTDENGFLKQKLFEPNLKVGIQSLSIHGINPKFYDVTKKGNWKEINLSLLGEHQNLITLIPNVCYEDCGGGGGGGGTSYSLRAHYLMVDDLTEFWTEGDIEVYFKYLNSNGWVSTQVVNMPNDTLENQFPGGGWTILSFNTSLAETPLEVWDEDDIWDDIIIYENNQLKIYNNSNYSDPPVHTFEGNGVGYSYIGGNFYSYNRLKETALGNGGDISGSFLKAYIVIN